METHHALYSKFMSTRRFPPGRQLQALAGITSTLDLQPPGETAQGLKSLCDEVVTRVHHFVDTRSRRAGQRGARAQGEAQIADNWVDALMVAIHTNLTLVVRRHGARPHPHGALAGQLIERFFGDGVGAVTGLPYEEQLVECEYIKRHLDALPPDARLGLNIEPLLRELDEALPVYRTVLAPEDRVTADELKAAYDAMHLGLMEVIAYILGHWQGEAHAGLRHSLLHPIIDQDERLAAHHAARRRGQSPGAMDVDGAGIAPGDVDGDGLPDEVDPIDDRLPAEVAGDAADAPAPAVEPVDRAVEGDGAGPDPSSDSAGAEPAAG